ncbi:hypothetical protein [Aurantimonas endophytica]|uniref:Uncharacterized protein n=1 Tax=Aurantimonas endophytica TaxID=1522175 RepID=A0A7W6MN84_9HYPH|nr:hypothetical protein [Aurantimonas endophytica]MBB4001579.1 hypothetical protein [Aurantimonas endophytica]MCO6402781.1 hypothetical protein [Aurantimonas endophytica]
MNWGFEDFAAAAALLGAAGIALVLIYESMHSQLRRVFLGVAVLVVTLAIWAHLAVGIL